METSGALEWVPFMYSSFESLKQEKGLKLVTLNVQSLREKHNYLKVPLVGLDYVGVTESWLKPSTPGFLHVNTWFSNFSARQDSRQ